MKIYYGTGEVFEGDPVEAPPLNVQVISQIWEGKPALLHGHDYYWLGEEGFFQGADTYGMVERWLKEPETVKKALAGRTIPKAQWDIIIKRAIEEK